MTTHGYAHDVRARVLIVDDEESSRRTVGALLQGSANEIAFADSGADALYKARTWQPDVILLDVMMPSIDGYEVCRRLRADPAIAEVRVFLLTALDGPEARLAGFEAGADDFITKPLNRAEALARIRGIARLNRYRTLINQHRELNLIQHSYRVPAEQPAFEDDELSPTFDAALASLYLVFHPIVRLGPTANQSTLFAHECLLRSREPGLPNPGSLLAAAAVLKRLPDVGRRVRGLVEEALPGLHPEEMLFVNVTANDLCDASLYDPGTPFARHASQMVLELTEREPIEGVRDVRGRIRRLRNLGFRFAIDDLGSGYSSLNGLAVVEPEFVKLDRELVQGVNDEPVRQKIVSSMLALCNDLGISFIVEGVETIVERQALFSLGCVFQQGWAFGRPAMSMAALPS